MSDDPDMQDMRRLSAAMLPYAKKLAEYAKANLPEGVHWGVFVLPPAPLRPAPGDKVGRMPVVAITSNRQVVAPQVAFWVMDTLAPDNPDNPVKYERGTTKLTEGEG